MAKSVKQKKIPVIKTRNSASMTESAFWSFLRSNLRKASRYWKPTQECKKINRRVYKGTNKKQKWEYLCASCNKYFIEKEISVDHKIECGQLNKGSDLEGFVNRLFVEVDGLQILCKTCHDLKTQEYRRKLKDEN